MNLKILSWNVRGLNEKEKRLKVRNFLRSWRADIVCLQETKLEWITRELVRSIWSCPCIDWLYLEFIGLCLCLSLGYLLAGKVDLFPLNSILLLGSHFTQCTSRSATCSICYENT